MGIQLLGGSFESLFPTSGQSPTLWKALAASFLEAAQATLYSHSRLETERKHFDFFFPYKIMTTFRISILKIHISLLCPGREAKAFPSLTLSKGQKAVLATSNDYHVDVFSLLCHLKNRGVRTRLSKDWGSAGLMKLATTEARVKTTCLALQWGLPCRSSLTVCAGPEKRLEIFPCKFVIAEVTRQLNQQSIQLMLTCLNLSESSRSVETRVYPSPWGNFQTH